MLFNVGRHERLPTFDFTPRKLLDFERVCRET